MQVLSEDMADINLLDRTSIEASSDANMSFVELIIADHHLPVLVDSGAIGNCMSLEVYKKIQPLSIITHHRHLSGSRFQSNACCWNSTSADPFW